MQLASSAWARRLRHVPRDRSGAVAVLVAAMIVPIVALVGLAIDYGIWNEAYASLSLAASSAALNAAKFAAAADANADSKYISEGVNAGKQWFLAELGQGSYAADNGTAPPTVTVSSKSNVITANVSYTSTVKSVFGRIYKKAAYPITVNATATMLAGSYLEVVLMLDNSSSMGIGATTADMTTMMQQTPCYASNEWTRTTSNSNYGQVVRYDYSSFQINWEGGRYDGAEAYPVVSGSLTLQASTPPNTSTSVFYCDASAVSNGLCPQVEQCPTNVNGYPAYAGAPCAFACHSDGSQPAGLGNDQWALARQKGATLRLDTVKVAANLVLTAMQNNNMSAINNLSVGIYTFNSTLNPIYPTSCTPQAFGCEAGSNWSTAISAVGLPPQTAGVYTDTGIQPPVPAQSNGQNTLIEAAMSNLANTYVTAAGDGSSATKPRKVLILITDGLEDVPSASSSGSQQAMPSSACQPFKSMGYTVYVIYTPYYPLMNVTYLSNLISMVEGTGSNSITYNLKACASNANDYVTASDQKTLNSDMLAFLTDALDAPATFTQ
jgi:Flp pilus assembly protein TadG